MGFDPIVNEIFLSISSSVYCWNRKERDWFFRFLHKFCWMIPFNILWFFWGETHSFLIEVWLIDIIFVSGVQEGDSVLSLMEV